MQQSTDLRSNMGKRERTKKAEAWDRYKDRMEHIVKVIESCNTPTQILNADKWRVKLFVQWRRFEREFADRNYSVSKCFDHIHGTEDTLALMSEIIDTKIDEAYGRVYSGDAKVYTEVSNLEEN